MEKITKRINILSTILTYLHQIFLFIICSMCFWGDMYFGYELGSLFIIIAILVFTLLSLILLIIKNKLKNIIIVILFIDIILDFLIIKSVVHW